MTSVLNIHWKDWCWSWNSNTLATWCQELTHWKRLWFWERLKAGGEGEDRGWDGWMASLTRWTWVWAIFRSRWWTGKPGILQSMGSQRVGHDWVTELWFYVRSHRYLVSTIHDLTIIPPSKRGNGGTFHYWKEMGEARAMYSQWLVRREFWGALLQVDLCNSSFVLNQSVMRHFVIIW